MVRHISDDDRILNEQLGIDDIHDSKDIRHYIASLVALSDKAISQHVKDLDVEVFRDFLRNYAIGISWFMDNNDGFCPIEHLEFVTDEETSGQVGWAIHALDNSDGYKIQISLNAIKNLFSQHLLEVGAPEEARNKFNEDMFALGVRTSLEAAKLFREREEKQKLPPYHQLTFRLDVSPRGVTNTPTSFINVDKILCNALDYYRERKSQSDQTRNI